jgi:hypothetical protein
LNGGNGARLGGGYDTAIGGFGALGLMIISDIWRRWIRCLFDVVQRGDREGNGFTPCISVAETAWRSREPYKIGTKCVNGQSLEDQPLKQGIDVAQD